VGAKDHLLKSANDFIGARLLGRLTGGRKADVVNAQHDDDVARASLSQDVAVKPRQAFGPAPSRRMRSPPIP